MNMSLLSLFSVVITCASSETFYIVTSPKSHCPQEFTGEPCLTLKQYASHPSQSTKFNITLIMESGNHFLQEASLRFQFGSYSARSYSFNMTAQSARIITTSSITIDYAQYVIISGITFIGTRVTVLRAQELVITSCKFQETQVYVNRVTDANISRCTFSNYIELLTYSQGSLSISSTAVNIEQCNFSNNEGAIKVNGYSSHINITESTFTNNTLEGAVYFIGYRASISVHQSVFINNTAHGSGGAIYFDAEHSSCSISGSIFIQNSADSCGALNIATHYGNNIIEITDSIFNYNRAVRASDIGGGAVCIMNAAALISNCTFIGNNAVGYGGAVVSHGSMVDINHTNFHNNSAGRDGGALITYTHPSNYTITHSNFTHNQAGDDGGAIFVGHRGSYIRLEMCTFSDNHAIDRGGAIAIFGSTIETMETIIDNNRAALGETLSSCNSNVMTSIYGHRDSNCSYDSTSYFNITSPLKGQIITNITLNITIGKFCIERHPSQPTRKELNKVTTAAYASLSISATVVLAFLLYHLIEKLVRSKIKCTKGSIVLSANLLHSEPLYDEAILNNDNTETIEMKPNVLYERCEPQSQAQLQEITLS